jgi:hypothetical protein
MADHAHSPTTGVAPSGPGPVEGSVAVEDRPVFVRWESHDSHGLIPRSCADMYAPHRPHDFDHRDGRAHCWGQDPLPADAVDRYCERGCVCPDHCARIRKGLLPRTIMCRRRWDALPTAARIEIADSVNG